LEKGQSAVRKRKREETSEKREGREEERKRGREEERKRGRERKVEERREGKKKIYLDIFSMFFKCRRVGGERQVNLQFSFLFLIFSSSLLST